jgi:HD-like signal output (HDOD) protein
MKVCSCCKRIYASERDYLHRTSRWRMSETGDLYFNCSCESTIVLPKGKHDWYHPSRFMTPEAGSVFNNFAEQTRFPLLSAVALEAQRLISDEGTSQHDIVEAIKLDPVLSLWILEMADVSRAKSSAPIRTMFQAINVLGRRKLEELVTISSASRFTLGTKQYMPSDYFSSMLMTGLIAQELAAIHGSTSMLDLAFVSGSLCNVGKLLGAICFPKEIDAVFLLTQQLSPSHTWQEAEAKLGSVDHRTLGEIAGALWGASNDVLKCISGHHRPLAPKPEDASTGGFSLVEIVTFANDISKYVLQNSHLAEPEIHASCLVRFGLNEGDFVRLVDSFTDQLVPRVQKSLEVLLLSASAAAPPLARSS